MVASTFICVWVSTTKAWINLGYECGCDHMKLIINNLNGKENKPSIGNYDEGIYMMKYNEIMVKKI